MKEKETASTNVVVNPLRERLGKPNENRSVQGELRLVCGKLRGQVDGAGKKMWDERFSKEGNHLQSTLDNVYL